MLHNVKMETFFSFVNDLPLSENQLLSYVKELDHIFCPHDSSQQ